MPKKLSSKQRAALAKGRAKLRAMRRAGKGTRKGVKNKKASGIQIP